MHKSFEENKKDFLNMILHPVLHTPISKMEIVKDIKEENNIIVLNIIDTLKGGEFLGEFNFFEYLLEEGLQYYFNKEEDEIKINYIDEDFNLENFTSNNIDYLKTISALKKVEDPEIHISVYDLGLIYNFKHEEDKVFVTMTLTTPDCPEAEILPELVENEIKSAFQEKQVVLELTFDPPWSVDKMPFNSKLTNNIF